jgi:hypothetical protein
MGAKEKKQVGTEKLHTDELHGQHSSTRGIQSRRLRLVKGLALEV